VDDRGGGSRPVSIIVFGGDGVFGALVCRELAWAGTPITVAGRDARRARELALGLGPEHGGVAADVRDPGSVRAALAGHAVAVHCAGPFSAHERTLLDACLESGCHYVDIGDDRGYAATVRERDADFRKRGLTAVFGCSSLPGLSGALAVVARDARSDPPARARVTLFIGNDNAKSETAIRSVVGVLGRAIVAPQGTLRGFREHERVSLPPPFGPRTAYAFDSPDYDLLPDAIGVSSVSVLVGFENALAGWFFSRLARVRSGWEPENARVLARLGSLTRGGSSGGTLVVDLFWPDGTTSRAGLHSARNGQLLAALPAVMAARALDTGVATARGTVTAAGLLGASELVALVAAAGFETLRA